ncbi:MAG: EsaB/YukD family protein [Acidobacteria bacterium]|nr:EsaB/YukD family protein [Acidobacteriota bacterium]MCI0625805.1 EsaB/YukD family protein [Acidobacteriota bacterium]MCI0721410.1 EsaB/YukD family protein [Acidobacteriota bacterium]
MGTASVVINKLWGVDLSGHKRGAIDGIDGGIPLDTTVGEIVSDMSRALNLPRDTTYHAEYQGRRLNRSETLEEAGLEDEALLTLHPEVTAG